MRTIFRHKLLTVCIAGVTATVAVSTLGGFALADNPVNSSVRPSSYHDASDSPSRGEYYDTEGIPTVAQDNKYPFGVASYYTDAGNFVASYNPDGSLCPTMWCE
jgi:hypothetical protein